MGKALREIDSLGEVDVPSEAYYGSQTMRAIDNFGADLTITLAAEAGQLQLNAIEPVIAYSMLQSISLLTNAARAFRETCIARITANVERCLEHLEASTAVVTALTPLIGYEHASDVAKPTLKSGQTIWDVLQSELNLSPDLLNKLRDPSTLTKPWKAQKLDVSKR